MIDAPGAAPSLPPWRVERILYDQDGILIVDKPVGMPVYGGDESLSHSVVDRLTAWLGEQERGAYLGVHQRLDQDTSGALFFVTQEDKNGACASAMEAHQIKRVYRAVVQKNASCRLQQSGQTELWLRHERGRSEVVAQPSSASPGSKRRPGSASRKRGQTGAKRALTKYRILRENGQRALLELELETGRTHQIRATMAHLGAPLVGDRLYGGAPAPRLMLHAQRVSGGPLGPGVEAPLPACFEQALVSEETELPSRADEFRKLLFDAATLRAPLIDKSAAFRLVNGAGDGLPGFTVDAYGAFATLNIYDASLLPRAGEIATLLQQLGFAGVYLKTRVKADLRAEDAERLAPGEVLVGQEAPTSYCVDEFGMQIHIELSDGLSTGLFVDMRDNRMKARSWGAAGRDSRPAQMLNLFCYTCSFSVSAALSGAVTTSVDLAGKALERGRANFEANGLDPAEHRFIREDAMKFLARAARRGDQYDFIVLDPPSFATVGKGTFSVKSRYGEAAADCLRILAPGGRLLCVTNHTKTSETALRKTIEAAARAAGRRLRSLKSLNPGLDCPSHPDGPWPSKSALCEVE